MDNTFWIVISLFPAFISTVILLLWLCIFKYESVKQCVASNDQKLKEQGRNHIKKLFKQTEDFDSKKFFDDLVKAHRLANTEE